MSGNKFCDRYIIEIAVAVAADPREIKLDGSTFVDQDGNEYSPVVTWKRHGNGDRKPSPINRSELESIGLCTLASGWETNLQEISNPTRYIRQFWNLDVLPEQIYTSDGVELLKKVLPHGVITYYAEISDGSTIDHISYGLDDLADRLQESPSDFAIKEPKRCAIPFSDFAIKEPKRCAIPFTG